MTFSDCERWGTLSDRMACGDSLSDGDHAFLADHPAGCGLCASEAKVWAALENALDAPEHLTGALTQERQQGTDITRPPQPVSLRRWPVLAAAAVMLLAVGSLYTLHSDGGFEDEPLEPIAVQNQLSLPSLVLTSGHVELGGSSRVLAGTTLRAGDILRVGEGRACLKWRGASVCAGASSEIAIETNEEREQILALRRGEIVAQVEKRKLGHKFVVQTPHGSVEVQGTLFAVAVPGDGTLGVRVQEGSVLVSEHDGGKRLLKASRALRVGERLEEQPADSELLARDVTWMRTLAALGEEMSCSLDVESVPAAAAVLLNGEPIGRTPLAVKVPCGSHQLAVQMDGFAEAVRQVDLSEEPVQHRVELERSPDISSGPEQKSPVVKASGGLSASELLANAREHRSAGRYGEAAAAYRRLVTQHRGSPEAGPALVSLGELELSQLDAPAAALRWFDTYVKLGGALAPEAHYGRIRALRKLGRHAEEQEAIERFLRDYPKSVQAARLRALDSSSAHP